MKANFIKPDIRQYTVILILGIMLMSLLSWVGFIRDFHSKLKIITKGNDDQNDVSVVEQINSLWDDNIFLKRYLSKIDSVMSFFVINEIPSKLVIKGDHNWLFFKTETDGNPIADYEGTNKYSKAEMQRIYEKLKLEQEEMKKRGVNYVILVAPNKENVYSQYMPDKYLHSEVSSADMLIDYLSQRGINVVSPKEELIKYKDDLQLYYKYDTHWNQLGAYVGVKSVLNFWNINIPKIEETKINTDMLKGNYHFCAEDDLAKMVGMRAVFNDEVEYTVEASERIDWEQLSEDQSSNKISHFVNKDAIRNESVFIVGDSFSTSLIPKLLWVFENVYVAHRGYYDIHMLDDIKPDYIVMEYVERYFRY